jgi:hypothetical protein
VTDEQAREAYRIGLRRSRAARARGGEHRYGLTLTDEECDILHGHSAVAEQFVALTTGRRWLSTGDVPDDPDAGDVEGGIGVRWTERDDYSLIVHPEDKDHLLMALVTGPWPAMTIRGWRYCDECKEQRWWRVQGVRWPAFFVPQGGPGWHSIGELEKVRDPVRAEEIRWQPSFIFSV